LPENNPGKMKKLFFAILSLLFTGTSMIGQSSPFTIHLEPVNIPGLGGLQAYAFGQANGKWLIAGGRLDGLHRKQPFASFDIAGNNNRLIVVDPVARQTWSAPLTALPVSLQEQLSSTNMEFHQEGNYLYLIGGYGYHQATGSKLTFHNLTAIDVPATIAAIINNSSFTPFFRQVTDPQFAVTGGQLEKIYDTYYLVGGNRFDGNYNPMGHPTYSQVYTNAIRKFNIADDGTTINITHLPAITDAENLHRRDFNALPQILPDGAEGITAFSGVFQHTADLPFLNCVNIDSSGYVVNNTFQQYYNHYHCAVLPMYSAHKNEMHNIFFGGIAQYYENAGVLVQDNNVPFVRTIARVTRNAGGIMTEYKLPLEMPDYLGASAEFIPVASLPHYPNKVLKLDELSTDSVLVGYIYGGISSTAPNIFWTNTGTESSASNHVYKVYIIKNIVSGVEEPATPGTGSLNLKIYPNPNKGNFTIKFTIDQLAKTKLLIFSSDGKKMEETELTGITTGENIIQRSFQQYTSNGIYIITIQTPHEKATGKIILHQ